MSLKVVALVLFVLIVVYYIGREISYSFRHPTDEGLRAYWNGELKKASPRMYRQMSEHLATCAECRERLEETMRTEAGPGADDPLIERRY